jgi:drug/metabolite transporter (DMT)-like permease
MTCIVSSLQYQSSGVAAILLTSGPAVTVLMAHFFLADERLTGRKGVGILLALAGALLLAVRGESGLPGIRQASPIGYGLVLLAVLCASGMNVYARKYMSHFDAFEVASIRMFSAALAVFPLSALLIGIDLRAVNGQGYAALAYAALVGTFFGMLLAFYNVKRFGATASAMTLYVIPVVAGVGGVLLLDEQFSIGMLFGMGLIGVGIALINQWRTGGGADADR